MDGEFLNSKSDNLNSVNVGSEGANRPTPISYTNAFYEHFPYYLSIGMSEEQYWDGDPNLAIYYREAEKIRKERRNQEMWLQGMYVYDAIMRVSPILHAFAKKGTKPHPYVEEAYAINKKSAEDKEERKAKATQQKGLRFMEAIMEQNNKRFGKDKEEGRK